MVNTPSNKKVALVTGASSDMGKDFAKALLNEGMIVYCAARRVEQMADLSKMGAITLKMDVTDDMDIQNVFHTIRACHGGVDVLINNVGVGMFGAMEDTTINNARYQFEVNLFGMARLTQLLLPEMRNKRAGKIINISSIGEKKYNPLGSLYHTTKHAVEGWSDCLRIELAQFDIDVIIIEPGAIKTEFGAVLMDPQVVTDLILKAIRSRKPKTRYTAGKHAKSALFIRKWFSGRFFNRMVLSTIKQLEVS